MTTIHPRIPGLTGGTPIPNAAEAAPPKFTVGQSDITATIARLRTTRGHQRAATTTTHRPLLPWVNGPTGSEDSNYSSYSSSPTTTPSPPAVDVPRRFPLEHPIMSYPGGEFAPFHPSLSNGRNSNVDKIVRDPLTFVSVTRAAPAVSSASASPQTTTTPPFATPERPVYMKPTTPSRPVFGKPESLNPSFHELMPAEALGVVTITRPPVRPTVPAPSPAAAQQRTPSPTFQARLNINPERKGGTKDWSKKEWTTLASTVSTRLAAAHRTTALPAPSPAVTGSPAKADCRGRIGYFSDMAPDCDAFL